jgi:putative Mn2+ efflux pump MntP
MNAFGFLVLFAIVQNIDNLVFAGAYRLRNVIISSRPNLVIASLSGVATAASVILAGVSHFEATRFGLGSVPDLIGRGILIMIGVWTLVGHFRANLFDPSREASIDHRGTPVGEARAMGMSTALIAGTALALDNIAPCFAFGLVNARQQEIIATGLILAVLTAAFSIVSVSIGQAAGGRGRNQMRWISPNIASGCLMIAIASFDPGDLAQAWLKL